MRRASARPLTAGAPAADGGRATTLAELRRWQSYDAGRARTGGTKETEVKAIKA
jgi:hypothetical protein